MWIDLIRKLRIENVAFPLFGLVFGYMLVGTDQIQALALMSIIVFLLHSAANIWNDIQDRDVDEANGNASTNALLNSSLGAIFKYLAPFFVLVSLVLSVFLPLLSMCIIAAILIVTWAYNGKPFRLSRRPVGSIIALSMASSFLPIVLGMSLGSPSLLMIALALSWWVLQTSLSVLKDYKDARGDSMHHKKTFLLVFGAHGVARYSMLASVVGFILSTYIMVLIKPSLVIVAMALAAAISLYFRIKLFVRDASYAELDAQFSKIFYIHIVFNALAILWLTQ